MLTINYKPPSSEYHFETKLKAKIYSSDQGIKKKEEELTEFNKKKQTESNMLSSENTKKEVINLTSEHPSSEDNFERNFQANSSPSDQGFEQQE